MGVNLLRKHVSIASGSCYRSVSRHPFMVFMVFVSILLYRSFPVLFSVLVYVSPVIASTLVLLGTLLVYGHENAPETQHHHHHHQIHNLGIRVLENAKITINDNNNKLKQEAKGELVNRYGRFKPYEIENDELSGSDRSRSATRARIYEDDKGWETCSDIDESFSPTGSMADINSMLDELRPLSGSEGPFPHVSTDATSDHSLESGEFVNENYDYDYDEDESVITWTQDDQRNFINLGTLELERNQLLENLIVRQKELKKMRMLAEKNMLNINPDHTHENNLGFDRAGPSFQSGSIVFQTNEPMGRRRMSFDLDHSTLGPYFVPEPIAFDPKSTGSHRASDISEYIYQRRRISEDDGTVKLHHQVALEEDRINEVNIVGGNTGYEEQTSSKSSSSSFFDVTDDIHDGDDDEEEEYRSIDSPTAHDSEEVQIEDSSSDNSATGNTEGGLSQRPSQVQHGLKSWLTRWKA